MTREEGTPRDRKQEPEVSKVFLCVSEDCGWMGGKEELGGSTTPSSLEEVVLSVCPRCGSKVEVISLPKGI